LTSNGSTSNVHDVIPTEEPIGLLVTRTARTLSRAFDAALDAGGGSLPTWLVLASLQGEAHGSQRSLAAAVGIEGPTLTHHLGRMEAEGLVVRSRDPRNRRVHQVELTEAGRARFSALVGVVHDFDQELRGGFTDEELTTLRALLGRLGANVGATRPAAGKDSP
jgi:MarR family transcriptional regulator for hemolysin